MRGKSTPLHAEPGTRVLPHLHADGGT